MPEYLSRTMAPDALGYIDGGAAAADLEVGAQIAANLSTFDRPSTDAVADLLARSNVRHFRTTDDQAGREDQFLARRLNSKANTYPDTRPVELVADMSDPWQPHRVQLTVTCREDGGAVVWLRSQIGWSPKERSTRTKLAFVDGHVVEIEAPLAQVDDDGNPVQPWTVAWPEWSYVAAFPFDTPEAALTMVVEARNRAVDEGTTDLGTDRRSTTRYDGLS